jgi:NADPH:quinone reductase-like Zn-dependent oxidoreductase
MNMHAIRIHKFGGPEVLQDDVLPIPEPGNGELLVRIEAASVNPVDYKIREGKFSKASDDALPMTLGRDLSGVVEACGSSADQAAVGQPVFALLGYDRGAYAQHVVLSPANGRRNPSISPMSRRPRFRLPR